MSRADDNVVFPYTPLQSERHFRVLKLQPRSYRPPPGRVSDQGHLHATLSEHRIGDNVAYECLSYVWGDFIGHDVLWLHGYRILIRDNLCLALRSIQAENKPQLIWVDFVCINQKDLAERTQQVGIMFEIYSGAVAVVTSLGGEADGSEHVPALLWGISEAHSRDEAKNALGPDRTKRTWYERDWIQLGLPNCEDEAWISLRKLLARPWFRRLWILQEVVAAKRLDVICGTWRCPGRSFFFTVQIAFAHHQPLGGKRIDGVPSLEHIIATIRRLNIMDKFGVDDFARVDEFKRPESLMEILELSRWAQCSDQRDKVFASLNLCTDRDNLSIQPRYDEPVRETYWKTARALLETGHGPRLICNAFESSSELETPSWVPDWSVTNKLPRFLAPWPGTPSLAGLPRAGGDVHKIRLGEGAHELLTEAHLIGTIIVLGEIHETHPCPPAPTEGPGFNENLLPMQFFIEEQDLAKRDQQLQQQAATSMLHYVQSQRLRFHAASHQRYSFPSLCWYLSKISSWVRGSPRYSIRQHNDVVRQTVLCDCKEGAERKSPTSYTEDFTSFYEWTKLHYAASSVQQEQWLNQLTRPLVTAGQISGSGVTTEDDMRAVCQLLDAEEMRARTFVRHAWANCFDLRPTVTESGFVGMIPLSAQLGDVVAVIRGVAVPMVLRPVAEGGDTAAQKSANEAESVVSTCYKVVGQAYFHGIMDGEVLDSNEFECRPLVLV